MRGVSGENLSPRTGEDRCPSLRRQAGRGQILLSSSICSVQLCKGLDGIYPHGRGPSILSVQYSSVAQLCLTLCYPMDYSMAGFPVHYQLPEPTQTHVLWVGDAIQPSHSLLSPSSSTFSLSQHQGLYKWVSSLNQVGIVLELQFSISPSNEYSGLISFRMDGLDLLAVQESSLTPQFKSISSSAQLSLQSNSHIHTWLLEKP